MRPMMLALTGKPCTAPLRSTRWMRLAPASTQRPAVATGSSENTVSSFMSPWRRRTQRPSFRSIAGISSMRSSYSKRTVPAREVGEQGQSGVLAFLGVELGCEDVAAAERRGEGDAVVGSARGQLRFGRRHIVTVHEVEPAAV